MYKFTSELFFFSGLGYVIAICAFEVHAYMCILLHSSAN